MKTKISCPLCNYSEAVRETYRGEIDLEEEYIHCPMCNYGYQYSYGAYIEHIDGKEWAWYYSDPAGEQTQIHEEIRSAKQLWRKAHE